MPWDESYADEDRIGMNDVPPTGRKKSARKKPAKKKPTQRPGVTTGRDSGIIGSVGKPTGMPDEVWQRVRVLPADQRNRVINAHNASKGNSERNLNRGGGNMATKKKFAPEAESQTPHLDVAAQQHHAAGHKALAQEVTGRDTPAARQQRQDNYAAARQRSQSAEPLQTQSPTDPAKHAAAIAENEARSAAKVRGPVDTAIVSGLSRAGRVINANRITSAIGATALAGAAVYAHHKKKVRNQQLQNYYQPGYYNGTGDIWPNQDGACAGVEEKAFFRPKEFGPAVPKEDDIVNVPGLVGRLARTVRS